MTEAGAQEKSDEELLQDLQALTAARADVKAALDKMDEDDPAFEQNQEDLDLISSGIKVAREELAQRGLLGGGGE